MFPEMFAGGRGYQAKEANGHDAEERRGQEDLGNAEEGFGKVGTVYSGLLIWLHFRILSIILI